MHFSSFQPSTPSRPGSSPFSRLTFVCFSAVCEYLPLADLLTGTAAVNRHWRAQTIQHCRARIRKLELALTWPNAWKDFHRFDVSPLSWDSAQLLRDEKDSSKSIFPQPPPPSDIFGLKWASDYIPGPQFGLSLARTLTHFCSTCSHLIIRHTPPNDDGRDGVLCLLSGLKDTLESLNLFICLEPTLTPASRQHRCGKLFTHINRLHRLQQLTLRFDSALEPLEPVNLPVLGWLQEFTFESEDNEDILYASLCRYAVENPSLRRINYVPYDDPEEIAHKYLETEAGRKVARHFVHLYAQEIVGSIRHLPMKLGQWLPSLTTVSLGIYRHKWKKCMRQLAHLPRLFQLILSMKFPVNPIIDDDDGLRPLLPALSAPKPPVLPSVKIFIFYTCNTDHRNLGHLGLPHLFPRLQVFELWHESCLRNPFNGPMHAPPGTYIFPLGYSRACLKCLKGSNGEQEGEKDAGAEYCIRAIHQEWTVAQHKCLKHVRLNHSDGWLGMDEDGIISSSY